MDDEGDFLSEHGIYDPEFLWFTIGDSMRNKIQAVWYSIFNQHIPTKMSCKNVEMTNAKAISILEDSNNLCLMNVRSLEMERRKLQALLKFAKHFLNPKDCKELQDTIEKASQLIDYGQQEYVAVEMAIAALEALNKAAAIEKTNEM